MSVWIIALMVPMLIPQLGAVRLVLRDANFVLALMITHNVKNARIQVSI